MSLATSVLRNEHIAILKMLDLAGIKNLQRRLTSHPSSLYY
jgi:hypothetical protein